MAGELILSFGLIFIAVAIQLQPWHWRLRNSLIAVGGGLSIAGLAIIYLPSLKVMLIGLSIGGLFLMMRHIIVHWSEYHGKQITGTFLTGVEPLHPPETAPPSPDAPPPKLLEPQLTAGDWFTAKRRQQERQQLGAWRS